MGSQLVTLTDVCGFQGGTQPPKSTFIDHEKEGYIRLLQIRDFASDNQAVFVPVKKNLKRCQLDDVLIGRYGASVGKILSGKAGAYNVALIKTIPDENKLLKKYLYYVLNGPEFQHFIVNAGSRAAQAGFNKNDLSKFEFLLPAIVVQKKVISILDKADAIRRKRKRAIELADELIQSTFLQLCTGETAWPKVTVKELASSKKNSMRTGPFGSSLRHSEFVNEGIAVLGIDNAVENEFKWGASRFITKDKYSDLVRYTVYPNDVIITIMGTTGRSAVVPNDVPTAISTKHLATITVDTNKVDPEYLSNAIHRDPNVLHQIKLKNRGAIMNGLNLGTIKELEIYLPPLDVQKKFVAVLKKCRLIKRKFQNDKYDELFFSLQQKAFKGEL